MRFRSLRVLPFVVTTLVACTGPEQGADQRLQARLDALAQRLDAIDQRLGAIDRDLPTGERLRSDLASVEQRLSAVDAKATEALATATKAAAERAAEPATGRPGGRTTAPPPSPQVDPTERRNQLGALMAEYRQRLADLQQQGGASSPAERAAARRQVREWYLARRRAILSGRPLPD